MQRLSLLLVGLMLFMLTINESFALPPTVQSSGISFSQIKDTEFRILIGTKGDGDSRIITIEPTSSYNGIHVPADGEDYTANANYVSAPSLLSYATAKVVYAGTGKNVIVTGLTPGTQYIVRVFERNGTGGGTEYLTSTASNNPRSNYTLPGVPATVSTSNVAHTSFRVSWTNPASGGFEGFHVTVSDDASFSYGLNWYDAVDVGNAHQLDVEDISPTDILPNTTYYYRVRAYQESRYGNWKTGAMGVTTLPENPTISASTATICLGNTYVLTPTGPNPGSGTNQHKFKVYNQASGGTALYNYALLSINLTPQSAGAINYYVATVSNKTGLESASRETFILTVNDAGPIADAGSDVVLCENAPYTYTFTGNNPAPADGEWSQISGPASINLAGVGFDDDIELAQYGTYVFRWTISNDGCTTTYDDVTVTLTQPPSAANITTQAPLKVCGSLTATVEAETPAAGIGTWTAMCFDSETETLIPCNPGLIFSPNANSPIVSVTAPAYGSYTLTWTVSNGTCDPEQKGITLIFDQTPTVANAGNDDGSCGQTSYNLNANAPTSGIGEWTQISGPDTAYFDDDKLHNTSVSVDEYGVYTFRWTIASLNDVCTPTSDDVVITFSEPISNAVAGVAHTLVCGDKSVFLNATPITVGNGNWTVVSSPTGSTYSFDNPTYPDAFFEADEFGSYTLRWTVTDPNGICPPKTSDITFAFSDNTTPANAGFDKDVCGLSTTLDGNIPTVGVGTWSKDGGDGDVTIPFEHTYNSNVSVSDWGTYSFEWKIESSCGTSVDYVNITFWNDLANWTAGSDFSSCGTNSTITLAGSNPTTYGAGVTGEWTKVSGPGLISYVDSTTKNDYNAQIQVNMIGTYVMRWTGYNGPCTNYDEVQFTVVTPPTVTFAPVGGPYCTTDNSAITLSATPSGGTFSGAGVSGGNFIPSLAGTAGTHTLTYTYTDAPCTITATQEVVLTDPVAITWTTAYSAMCEDATLITLTGNATPAGGTYSGLGVSNGEFNPATAGPGTHTITYTYTDGGCVSTATNTIVVNAKPTVTFSTIPDQCTTGALVDLTAYVNQTGGSFNGTGVSVTNFDPSVGAGTYTLTYTYTDANTCTNTATSIVTVVAPPSVTFDPVGGPYCATFDSDITLSATPSGGTFSGAGVSGTTFNPSRVGTAGTYTLTYTFTSSPCTVIKTQTVVLTAPPTITWTNTYGPVCTDATPITLTGDAIPTGGTYSGLGVTGNTFYPSVAGAGTHTITYTYSDGGCVSTATKTIVVDKLPTITWTASYGPYCQNAGSVTLTASTDVGTGSYSGAGVTGNTFNPSAAGAGTHTITYTVTNGSCASVTATKTIVVDELPTITWSQTFSSVCENSNGVPLSALTSVGSGAFSGNGVTGNMFYPSAAGVGTHTITYTATNGACSVFESKTIVVDKLPTITWTASYGPYCQNAGSVTLTASTDVGTGSYSGAGVTGSIFYPNAAGVGTHTITYTATNGDCSVFATKTIVVDKLPTITWTQTFSSVCINANPLPLTASTDVGTGSYSGAGVSGNTFNPGTAGVGTHTITYTATNGACSVFATKTIVVNGLPTVSAGTYNPVCVNSSSFTLTQGSPAGGTYSGTGVTSNVFNPTSAGVGVHTLTYTYTDANGCTNSATTTITVNALVSANAGNDDEADLDELSYQLGATNPSPATGLWTKVSGDGTATFASASTFNTNVTVSAFGTYTFRWTVTNGACVSSDDVVITFVEGSAVATKLHIINPGTQISGTAFNLTVQTLDQYNNPVAPTGTVNFTITVQEGDATFSTTVTGSITAPAYSTTLSVTLNAGDPLVGAADVNLEATDNANDLASGTSAYFNLVATVPTVQASNLSFSNWTTNSVDLSWASNGDGDGVIVMGTRGRLSIPATYKFTNGASYTANATFGSGTSIAANTYTVYQGTGSSVSVTNLSSKTQYAFKVCAYQGAGNLRSFNNTNAALNSNNRGGMTLKGAFDSEDLPLVGDNVLSASHISPNPARDYVMMTVDLTQSANLKIAFFTADGKQVLLPVNGATYNAGRHSFNVPLKGLAAGVYSVVITADNEVIIDNVVVMP